MIYMKNLLNNPNLSPYATLEGLSEEKIIALEAKYNDGNSFPIAFREYLSIAGIVSGTGVVDNDFDDLYERLEEHIGWTGYKIERPFMAFDKLDGQFTIFFLDEEKEDPDCYIFYPSGKKEGHSPLLWPCELTFSELVNEAIRRKKNNIPF